ncbi:MAG: 6-carboxytetrahydropterin synthase QueD [Sulfuricurvum sp.]|jgi:6-pyruvoyltetrahydropterin/6-carboxytetrahydropterin synthase|nr:6-carboxytetrahydropterin synthase QueD [Sulfuricurvum sp.]
MISICRQFRFEAAHHLPHHKGKCRNIHGHSYRLEIEITGPIVEEGPSQGMVLDFGDLKEIVERIVLEDIDHQDLNNIWQNPTAETMVEAIASCLQSSLSEISGSIIVMRVRLWETINSYAEWRKE